jgi:homoprotocatechuate degradation regulator HpaR
MHVNDPDPERDEIEAPTQPVGTGFRGFEASLPIALLRARAATAQKFKRHTDAVGLTQPQWRVLRALAAGTPLDSRTLAHRCALLQPSLSRILQSLEGRGLIAPVPSDDARRRPVAITARGQAIFEHVAILSEAVYRDIEAVYGRDELARLVAMLSRLREVAEALPDLPVETPDLPPLPPGS